MFIIVGLGNPGREYENTRHNVGFMTVDMLADRFNIEVKRHNFRAVFGEGYIGGQKVVLAKPETYRAPPLFPFSFIFPRTLLWLASAPR